MNNSKFIVFEGADGTGKSTLVKSLTQYLTDKHKPFIVVKEPSDSPLGVAVRQWIKEHDFTENSVNTVIALNLFMAARIELIHEKIIPALNEGKIVLCDRFALSTAVYQGLLAESNQNIKDYLKTILSFIQKYITVTDTVFIDLPPYEACKRISKRLSLNESNDLIDAKSIVFHQNVYERYKYLLNGIAFPQKLLGTIHKINGLQTEDKVLSDTIQSLNI